MGVVAVGVDGSDASMDALRFAAGEARLRNVSVAGTAAARFGEPAGGASRAVPSSIRSRAPQTPL